MDKAAELETVAAAVRACTRCRLHSGRTKAVPGYGDPNAEIMFIGEGPGYHEDQQGLPFVGRSGQYLDYLLDKIGLKRGQVFIANVIKCRPPNNRDPLPDEITACQAYLDRQIEIIDPLVIATLGRFSMARYFPNARISRIHGQARFEQTPQGARAYYPFYHPAAALRNPNLRHDMERDFARLLDVLEQVRQMRRENLPLDEESSEPPEQLSLF